MDATWGEIEPTDKNPRAALEREVSEELKIRLVNIREYMGIGGISASGRRVYVHAFLADIDGSPVPSSEIEELRWVGCTEEELQIVSPVTRDIMACMQTDGYL